MACLRLFSPCPLLARAALASIRPFSGSAATIMGSVAKLPAKERLQVANQVLQDTDISVYKQIDVCEQIVDTLARDFTWDILSALREDSRLLELLRKASTYSLNPIVDIMLLSLKARKDIHVDDVVSIIMFCSYVFSLSRVASENFVKAESLLLPLVPHINNTEILFRLIITVAIKLRNAEPTPALVLAAMKRLTVLLPDDELLFSSKTSVNLICESLRGIMLMRIRDEPFMDVMSQVWEKAPLSTVNMGVSNLWQVTTFFSQLCFPATNLFHRLTDVIEAMDAQPARFGSSGVAFGFLPVCWSYLAQGLDPPEKAMEMVCRNIAASLRLDSRDTVASIELLQQLKPYLPFEVDGLESCVRRSYDQLYTYPMRMASQAQIYHQHVTIGLYRPEGFVPLAALVDPGTGELLPWPSDCGPMDVSEETAPGLPGVPVALLMEKKSSMFVEPKGMFDGVLEMKCRLLKRSGWMVTVQFREQLTDDNSWGKDYVTACIKAMKQAAVDSVSDDTR
eukprot:scpid61345/ scgid33514/ 